jgi:site-specific DNA-methyltransferase (adenine-specific)/modification methylase
MTLDLSLRWQVIHGDCLEVMRQLPDGCVDAVVTDPPYGMAHPTNYAERGRGLLAPNKNFAPVFGDDKPYDPSPILALNVPTVLWGANWFADKLPPTSGWLVWDKERPDDLDQATCELAWTNCIKGVRRFRHLWNGMLKATERGESYHPTQKPVALTSWILSLRWFPKGDILILDPYAGSGPVGVAAVLAGYRYIGIEREASYVDIARRRIADAAAQGNLFDAGAA